MRCDLGLLRLVEGIPYGQPLGIVLLLTGQGLRAGLFSLLECSLGLDLARLQLCETFGVAGLDGGTAGLAVGLLVCLGTVEQGGLFSSQVQRLHDFLAQRTIARHPHGGVSHLVVIAGSVAAMMTRLVAMLSRCSRRCLGVCSAGGWSLAASCESCARQCDGCGQDGKLAGEVR